MSQWREEKKIVLEAAKKMLAEGLVVGTGGNISLRLPSEGKRQLLAITPSGQYYDLLGADDIQIVDFRGQTIEGSMSPSIETTLHINLYRARKNINAVIHTHSVFASAVSVTGHDIPPIMNDQVAFLGGEIKLSKHGLSGSPEQTSGVLTALEDRNGVLLPNHGSIGIGRTMRDAFTACELIEKTARIYLLALSAGTIEQLPANILEAEKAAYDKLQREE